MVKAKLDKGLFFTALFLIGLGLIQVYSTSFIFSYERFGDGLYFFKKQFFFAGIALAVLTVLSQLSWRQNVIVGWAVLLGSALGIVLTFIPGVGVKVGGAHRWLQLPMGFRAEPAEFFKISFPFLLVPLLADGQSKWRARRVGLAALLLGVLIMLLMQPDFGTFVILSLMLIGVLFVFGLKTQVLILGGLTALASFWVMVVQVPYRWARVQAFWDPWADAEGKGFQIIQSLLSISGGRLFGEGLGESKGKLFYLPEAHTDFTLAVLGEELGFIGMLTVLTLFGFLIFRFFQITWTQKDMKTQVVALGLTLWFSLQVFINVAVVIGMVPTKGLTLPFLSYGGSSLLATSVAMGWMLSLSSKAQQ